MPVVMMAAFVLLNLVVRAAYCIVGFNAEDRYISYIWPLYALGLKFIAHLEMAVDLIRSETAPALAP